MSECGSERGAPLGVPVVPLVKMTSFGSAPGLGGGDGSPSAISVSRVDASGASLHAVTVPRRTSLAATASAYSLSCTSSSTPSRRTTSASCASPKSVFSNTIRVPLLAAANNASRNPRWLRATIADAISGAKAPASPRVCHRVRPRVDVGESQRAAVVGQRDTVTVADRGYAHRRSDRAVVAHRARYPAEVAQGYWAQTAGSRQLPERPTFVTTRTGSPVADRRCGPSRLSGQPGRPRRRRYNPPANA